MSSSNLSPTTLDYLNIATTSEIVISETIETICEKLFESLLNSDRNSGIVKYESSTTINV